jgi:hypothetical protein
VDCADDSALSALNRHNAQANITCTMPKCRLLTLKGHQSQTSRPIASEIRLPTGLVERIEHRQDFLKIFRLWSVKYGFSPKVMRRYSTAIICGCRCRLFGEKSRM